MKYLLSTFLIVLFYAAPAQTTAFEVKGRATEAGTGDPLVGLSIVIKGSRTGTTTNREGAYSITVPNKSAVLVFSYVGFLTREVMVGDRVKIDVAMEAHARSESEVVVVGYGVRRYSRSVSAAAIADKSAAMPEAVAGKTPGLVVRNIASGKNTIRGIKSMSQISRNDNKFFKYKQAVEELVTEKLQQHPGDKKDAGMARTLTAGEWNDLDNWAFWQELSSREEALQFQKKWEQYYQRKITVKLFNKLYEPQQGVRVILTGTGKDTLWRTVTDAFGQAVLWPGMMNGADAADDEPEITPTGELLVLDHNNRVVDRHSVVLNADKNYSFVINTKKAATGNVDVMFMVDATGSMGDEINYLKAELNDIFGRLRQCATNDLLVRIGQVFYRDHSDEYLVRDLGFDSVVTEAQQKLARQAAGGGGDYEEAVESALDSAIHHKGWLPDARAKLLFMVLDAPPHYDSARVKKMKALYAQAAARGIMIIPVASSGVDKNTEFLLRFGAMATNGTYVFLTDDSGVGGSHLKPTIGKYKVELLNDLMLRLILRYSGYFSSMAFR